MDVGFFNPTQTVSYENEILVNIFYVRLCSAGLVDLEQSRLGHMVSRNLRLAN